MRNSVFDNTRTGETLEEAAGSRRNPRHDYVVDERALSAYQNGKLEVRRRGPCTYRYKPAAKTR